MPILDDAQLTNAVRASAEDGCVVVRPDMHVAWRRRTWSLTPTLPSPA